MSQGEVSRLERFEFPAVALARLAEISAVLGLELSASLHGTGEAIRDAGHEATVKRFLGHIHPAFVCAREVPLPNVGDRRSWDVLLRLGPVLIGVEVETRIRDIQALVRRIRERERDGGVDHVLLVLADTIHNRHLVGQLREALGLRFVSTPREALANLRAGKALIGSAVVLV
jgi:hypothetical protein